MAPRPKAKKKFRSGKALLALTCRWDGCGSSFEQPLEEYQIFAEHVMEHIKKYLESLSVCETDEGTSLPPLVSYKCLWNECSWEVRGEHEEFCRHVMFHAYHSRLKCLGAFEMLIGNANQCELDPDTQDLLPNVSQPFLCKWESCGLSLLCPDKFYRHVEMHGYDASKEDVMVVIEKDGKPSIVDGMAVQKMMQSVCRWEGCSFLAKTAVKIKEHCRTHTGERQLACPTCGGFFSNKTKFIDHLTRQNAKLYENFQCSHCLKRCASERLLRDHMRHHVNHVKCPYCDMTCGNPSGLRGHIKFRHSTERPFKCAMCDYSCKTKFDLKRHEETHFARRYACEVENCDFSGKTLAGLRSHIKLVHELSETKDRFMCHICERRFSRGYILTTHLKSDHDFSWPSGHSRFRYKKYEDGFYRLQMVRFESAELSELLIEDQMEFEHENEADLMNEESHIANILSAGNADDNLTGNATEVGTHTLDTRSHQNIDEALPTSCEEAPPVELNLCGSYLDMLHYYEAVNAGEKEAKDESANPVCRGDVNVEQSKDNLKGGRGEDGNQECIEASKSGKRRRGIKKTPLRQSVENSSGSVLPAPKPESAADFESGNRRVGWRPTNMIASLLRGGCSLPKDLEIESRNECATETPSQAVIAPSTAAIINEGVSNQRNDFHPCKESPYNNNEKLQASKFEPPNEYKSQSKFNDLTTLSTTTKDAEVYKDTASCSRNDFLPSKQNSRADAVKAKSFRSLRDELERMTESGPSYLCDHEAAVCAMTEREQKEGGKAVKDTDHFSSKRNIKAKGSKFRKLVGSLQNGNDSLSDEDSSDEADLLPLIQHGENSEEAEVLSGSGGGTFNVKTRSKKSRTPRKLLRTQSSSSVCDTQSITKADTSTDGRKQKRPKNKQASASGSKNRRQKQHSDLEVSENPKSKRAKHDVAENETNEASEHSNDSKYEQVILDVSRTLLSLHNADNDGKIVGIPFLS